MLRPLLVQWLNDNMPRILENAIRDEIQTRGLLPKSDS
jgi:cell pole-organizing protein PopZ